MYDVHLTLPERRRNNCTSRWQRPVWQLRTIITDIARGTSGETTPPRGIACHLASTNTHHRCHYIVFAASTFKHNCCSLYRQMPGSFVSNTDVRRSTIRQRATHPRAGPAIWRQIDNLLSFAGLLMEMVYVLLQIHLGFPLFCMLEKLVRFMNACGLVKQV